MNPFPDHKTGTILHTHFGVSCADPMEHERIDESRCYFCGFDKNCDLRMQTHFTLCLHGRNTNPTQGWWDSNDKDIHLDEQTGSLHCTPWKPEQFHFK